MTPITGLPGVEPGALPLDDVDEDFLELSFLGDSEDDDIPEAIACESETDDVPKKPKQPEEPTAPVTEEAPSAPQPESAEPEIPQAEEVVAEAAPEEVADIPAEEPVAAVPSEPQSDVEMADPEPISLPVDDIDQMLIAHIMQIQTVTEFRAMFRTFEEAIHAKLVPLRVMLNKVVMSNEVPNIQLHAAKVEMFRHKVGQYHKLAMGFAEFGKSSRFRVGLVGGKKLTVGEIDAYRRMLTAGYAALAIGLEHLIEDVDSRVNLCKKYSDGEHAGFRNFGGR